MNFMWNEAKRKTNLKKHGLDTRFAYTENRFSTIGLLGVEVVVIAHTETADEIHIISMRKAERHEQKNYFASL